MAKQPDTVYGQRAAAPRITPAALRLVALRIAAPLIAALLLFDLAIWWLVREVTGGCFALWCWF